VPVVVVVPVHAPEKLLLSAVVVVAPVVAWMLIFANLFFLSYKVLLEGLAASRHFLALIRNHLLLGLVIKALDTYPRLQHHLIVFTFSGT
jgi:hypothetical protein